LARDPIDEERAAREYTELMEAAHNQSQVVRNVIYVDVDDTLIRTVGTKRIPMTSVVAYVRRMKGAGAELYCWSTGGAAYAQQSAQELGIAACFAGFLPKPTLIVDDQAVADWRQCAHVLPANC
jgi:cation transport ATPase